jgi:hypothetical protein
MDIDIFDMSNELNVKSPSAFVHEDDLELESWLFENIGSKFWIAGGACLSWYQKQACESDIDLFFPNQKAYDKALSLFQKLSKPTLTTKKIIVIEVSNTDNAVTFKIAKPYHKAYDIQLIKRRFYSTVDQLFQDFDFSVCRIAWDGQRVYTDKNFATDVKTRRLRVEKMSKHTPARLVKYWVYGFTPTDEDLDLVLQDETASWEQSNDPY